SLDEYMRAMWRRFGKPGGAREGYVDRPYTIADAESVLGEVSGDRAFAREFFVRYIEGHDVADYASLLARAGFAVRRRADAHAWLGDVRLDVRNGTAYIGSLVSPTWPLYATGLDQDDELRQVDGERIGSADALAAVLRRHRPGDRVDVVYADRLGTPKTATVVLADDPHQEIVMLESSGGALTPEQRTFRD